ncbi:hypothetical protein [Metabacillus fastidiosus]|uniref:hypothetical protein n=1 Tax=Metabacillus fastidiosus TaxID=1458 RepID=UPI002DB93527|nr:hypothetical protein [Metabacillus fastidiosus]MEC2077042.1 hypothetical protein [Metabacillus fastidiosus]
MNIVEKIDKGNCSVEELEKLLDEKNPIILYYTMTAIGNYGGYNENIITKLNKLSFKREANDKLLGYYKIGDLAIVTLQKIGENVDGISSYQTLDDFERKMLIQLAKEVGW